MKFIYPALGLALSLTCAWADDTATSRKGICLAGKGNAIEHTEKKIEAINAGWHYNWTAKWDKKAIKDTPFVPSFFGSKK